ncbi:MAG TPA: hypothetical protein PKC29_11485 [Thermodesulfobacteriota bacterium]|nr:hypothetical protein [Thermodesulfobacteriota bacterium]
MMLNRMFKRKSVKVISILTFLGLMVLSQHACVDSLDSGDESENPVNTFIMNMSANPNTVFGNASEESFIQVDTLLVPDGSEIDYEITFSSSGLPPALRGCLFDSSGTVINNEAFVNYLSGVLVGINETASINISATVRLADGRSESDFTTLTLDGVGLVAATPGPDTDPIIVPHPSTTPAPTNIAVPLTFQSVGLEPGTLVEISLSNPDIGSLNGGGDPEIGDAIYVAPILGNVNSGQFFVQYNAFVGQAGTQIILARTQIQIPPEFITLCPLIAEEDGLIEVVVIITQEVAAPPTPGPTPGPDDGGGDGSSGPTIPPDVIE